jgi:hypothetical protein
MPEATAADRPGQPRTGPPRSATRTLHVVTDGKTEVCTADLSTTPTPTIFRGSTVARLKSAITDRDRLAVWWAALAAYFTPPSVFVDRPASLAELAAYARFAPWTRQEYIAKPHTDEDTGNVVKTGPLRAFGVAWYRYVGYPYTVASRYREWIAQRPGRAVPVLLLVKLLASTTPGAWVVANVVMPVASAVAWALL